MTDSKKTSSKSLCPGACCMQVSTPNRCHGADPELKCKMKPGALVAGDRALALAIAHQVPRWPAGPGPSRPQRGTH